jgi:Arc/MetJ-type ribon-helix-helix transcriptional regulator
MLGHMTKKIGISLPDETYAWIQAKIERGAAETVSGVIAQSLERERKREELRDLLAEWSAEIGPPSADEQRWVDEAVTKAHVAATKNYGDSSSAA